MMRTATTRPHRMSTPTTCAARECTDGAFVVAGRLGWCIDHAPLPDRPVSVHVRSLVDADRR